MPKSRGRPKGSKNQPTLFPMKKKEATFLSIPNEILIRINAISQESKYTKQQVLEDILKNGLFTVLKMYRGVIETRKALDSALQAEKEEHEKPSRPSARIEPKAPQGDSENGLTEGSLTGGVGPDSAVPGTEELSPMPDFVAVGRGQPENVSPDSRENLSPEEQRLAEEVPF